MVFGSFLRTSYDKTIKFRLNKYMSSAQLQLKEKQKYKTILIPEVPKKKK